MHWSRLICSPLVSVLGGCSPGKNCIRGHESDEYEKSPILADVSFLLCKRALFSSAVTLHVTHCIRNSASAQRAAATYKAKFDARKDLRPVQGRV